MLLTNDDEVWNEFKTLINTNGKDTAPAAGEPTLLAALNAIIKRRMCRRGNELACTTKQSAASEYK
jgi:hypothetical protein